MKKTLVTLLSLLPCSAVFASTPLAHWSFDRITDNTYAAASADAPAAQIAGTVTSAAGRTGEAASFAANPPGQLKIFYDLAALASQGAFTVEVWVRPTAKAANYGNCVDAGSQKGFVLRTNQTGRLSLSAGGTWNALHTSAAVPLNRWTHAAVVYADGQLSLFVAGQKVGQAPLANPAALGSTIAVGSVDERRKEADGSISTNTVKGFTGQIDDLKIHPRALSAEEIAAAAR